MRKTCTQVLMGVWFAACIIGAICYALILSAGERLFGEKPEAEKT